MSEDHFIVLGNGPAGHQAALTLKERAPDARVTLIGRERGGYYRPNLLPDFIAGKIAEENLYGSKVDAYREKGIKLRSGQRVVDVRPMKREILLDHKEVIPFEGLIIAVGGRPRIPEPLLIFRDLMLTLKTLDHAKVWIEKLAQAERILIIGGDLTSLSLTKALLHLKKDVYFMINEEAFWPLKYDENMFSKVARKLESRGVKPLKGRRFRGMTRLSEQRTQIRLKDETIEVDLVGAFFGLVPDVDFLARSGFSLDRGILVDESLNTGFKGIYATGDCAQVYHPELRDYWVSIGWENAVTLGRTAARNLLGEKIKAEMPKESIFEVQGVKVNTSWWMEF